MTREVAIARLKVLQSQSEQYSGWDQEGGHIKADDILCALLVALGYEDVVAEWQKVPKWYA